MPIPSTTSILARWSTPPPTTSGLWQLQLGSLPEFQGSVESYDVAVGTSAAGYRMSDSYAIARERARNILDMRRSTIWDLLESLEGELVQQIFGYIWSSNAGGRTIALEGCHHRFQCRGGDSQPWSGEDNGEHLLGAGLGSDHLLYRPQQTLVCLLLETSFQIEPPGRNQDRGNPLGHNSQLTAMHSGAQVHDEQNFLVPRVGLPALLQEVKSSF